ncbi:MAG: mandelate racemase/muconate lactonizing enzyme family protein [Anaerolineae bacterium]|nr:mandelate racemase/muconate lactonizing enzyme family protein [Candidatus Roseilinea sp.]MDW8451455.1 mandelate racemase/muconate lactonizing enzyme family protein [Anaerolineae bacterium]
MKISNVRFIALRQPLQQPLRLAWGAMHHRHFGLVIVETDAGITGVGETSVNFPGWAIVERKATIEEGLKPLLIGEDPLDVEGVWCKMHRAFARLGVLWGKGAVMSAIGGVDIALWDIAGKANGKPIYALLGGTQPARTPLYATGLDPANPADSARAFVDRGYRAVKVRIGFDEARDIANVEAVRRAVGDDIHVLVDANMAYDLDGAKRMAAALHPYRLYWLEEPLVASDLEGYRALKDHTDIPLAAGENQFDVADATALLDTQAIRYLMPDPTRAGGLSEARRICALAQARGLPYSPHHYGSDVGFAAALHLIAAMPGASYMLRDVAPAPLRESVLRTPISIESGCASMPDGPGLGIELNWDAIHAHEVRL